MIKTCFVCAAAVVGLGSLALTAHASSVGFAGLPKVVGGNDVTAQLVDVTYTASTGEFKTVNPSPPGFNLDVQLNGTNLATQGAFSFDVFLTNTGAIDTTKLNLDSLSVLGGSTATNVLFQSSSFLGFGYDSVTGTPMHMLFGAGSLGLGTSGVIGVNLTGSLSGFSDFNHNFSALMLNADTFNAVPLPPAAFMALSALPLGAIMLRRRRTQTA